MDILEQARNLRKIIEKSVQSLDKSDSLKAKCLYPTFENLIGENVNQNTKFTYNGELYKTRKQLIIQSQYYPRIGTESLYEVINKLDSGDINNPIPYNINLVVYKGKYYIYKGVKYKCIRDSGNPLYAEPEALIGNYFKKII